MEVTRVPDDVRDVIRNNRGMELYLRSLAKGRPFTPRSWLYESMEPDDVLHVWLRKLNPLAAGTEFERNVYQFDISQLEKWGPQGGIAPIDALLEEKVYPSFAEHSLVSGFSSARWQRAKRRVKEEIRRLGGYNSLTPRSYSAVIDDMRSRDTLESNSGYPDFARRNLNSVRNNAIKAAENGSWKRYPAIILFRNYNNKTRPVWMYPMAANLVEGSFVQPLQDWIVKHQIAFFDPWVGFERVRRSVTHAYESGRYLAASDFTSTDEHFRMSATEEVFDVIKVFFPQRYHELLHESLVYMHNIPLIIGPDRMIKGEHGVSSGSNWTNFIETIFDWILGYYADEEYVGLYGIGDDMTWASAQYSPTFADTLASAGEAVGQIIKAEKTTNDPNKVKSLQRLFQRGYMTKDGMVRAVYPTIRALKSMVYPERFHNPKLWSSDMFCARIFMILENCVDHPKFEEFVEWTVHGQKDLIPFAKQKPETLDRIQRETKLLPGFNPT